MKKAMHQHLNLFVIALISTILIVFWGCDNTRKKQENKVPDATDITSNAELVKDLSGYPIPTAIDITTHIYKAQAPYQAFLANGPENAGQYITQRDKVLNLGVYSADLCYSTTYMMKQGTMNYLEATKVLVDDIGISSTFNITYAERIEQNIDNRDSLIVIVSESFDDTWNYLVENQQDVLARLVVCGSWIEGIYITANVVMIAVDNTAILEALAKQKTSLNELVNLLESVKDVDEVVDLYKSLVDIQSFYDGVGDTMTADQLKILTEKIGILRNSII